MSGRQRLPEDIEVMPPGPDLAVALAAADRSRLSDADLVVLAPARARQLAHEQAGQLADLLAIADAVGPDPVPPTGRIPGNYNPDQWAEATVMPQIQTRASTDHPRFGRSPTRGGPHDPRERGNPHERDRPGMRHDRRTRHRRDQP